MLVNQSVICLQEDLSRGGQDFLKMLPTNLENHLQEGHNFVYNKVLAMTNVIFVICLTIRLKSEVFSGMIECYIRLILSRTCIFLRTPFLKK